MLAPHFPWVIAAVGVVVSLLRAGKTGLWFDEAWTARVASLSFQRALAGAAVDVHPPGWVLVEWLAIRLPVPMEFAARLPSCVAFGVIAAIAARRHPLLGLAVLFHLPLLDLAAQGRPYAALAACMAILVIATEAKAYLIAGLIAGFAASLHGAGPLLVGVAMAALVPWRKLSSLEVGVLLASAIVPQLWWVPSWTARIASYPGDPFYVAKSLFVGWWSIGDGWIGLVACVVAVGISARPRVAAAAVFVVAALLIPEVIGYGMEVRKLGVIVAPLLLLAVGDGPRKHLAAALVLVGLAVSTARIDVRPDLRAAADALAALPPGTPVASVYASETRLYVRRPGPVSAPLAPDRFAQRIADLSDATGRACVAATALPGGVPQEGGLTLPTVAWAPVEGLEVRLYGGSECRVGLAAPWRAGHPCDDPAIAAWMCPSGR